MKPQKGYYSVIQYCPDLSRFEAANIGVLLFCPDSGFLRASLSSSNSRIRKFFGAEGHDWKRVNTFKKALQDRLGKEQAAFRSVEDLQQFIATRANVIQFTAPRPMKVVEPDKDLQALYEQIIGTPTIKESQRDFKKSVADSFSAAGIERKLLSDVKVKVPIIGEEIQMPFGFQNGRFNLINPVQFSAADPKKSFQRACTYAVEGRSLYEHPDPQWGKLQLVIVGRFRASDDVSPVLVRRVFDENEVKLYSAEQLPQLIDEIRTTGRELDFMRGQS